MYIGYTLHNNLGGEIQRVLLFSHVRPAMTFVSLNHKRMDAFDSFLCVLYEKSAVGNI